MPEPDVGLVVDRICRSIGFDDTGVVWERLTRQRVRNILPEDYPRIIRTIVRSVKIDDARRASRKRSLLIRFSSHSRQQAGTGDVCDQLARREEEERLRSELDRLSVDDRELLVTVGIAARGDRSTERLAARVGADRRKVQRKFRSLKVTVADRLGGSS